MRMRIGELRRLIREALVGGERLALCVRERYGSQIEVVLYSSEGVERNLGEVVAGVESRRGVAGVLRGMATYELGSEPCHGAWSVTQVAGPGYGRILYGLGYNLTPEHRLMPDRDYTSARAGRAWAGAAGKRLRGLPLDDIEDPATPDPSDDCTVKVPRSEGGPDPVLDVAYEGGELPVGEIEAMGAEHRAVVELLGAEGVGEERWVLWLLAQAKVYFMGELSRAVKSESRRRAVV
jgi:hypothetical protein